MSWSLFKANIIRKTNPRANNNIETVAKIWAEEYDACVKRGRDFINLESVQTGNKEIMETLFKIALLKGLTIPPGVDFSLVNEFGNGVKAYWAGAQMRQFPIPLIPAPGSIQNLSVSSNIVTNTGTWPLYPPIKPARKQEVMIDMFILAATIHLFTIGGFIQTTSLYPSTPTPIPSPGIINWRGYFILPIIRIPNINFPSEDGSEPPFIEQPVDVTNDIDITTPIDTNDFQNNLLGDNTSLENVINVSIPADVANSVEIDKIVKDFKRQIQLGGTKCE